MIRVGIRCQLGILALDEGADLRKSEPDDTMALHGAVLANQPSFVI